MKIDDFAKLEKKMATKEDIKHNFIPQLSTQEEDKEENYDLFQPRLEKIEKQLESRKLESSKVDDSLQHHGINSGPRNYFIPKIDMRKLVASIQSRGFFKGSNSLIYTR